MHCFPPIIGAARSSAIPPSEGHAALRDSHALPYPSRILLFATPALGEREEESRFGHSHPPSPHPRYRE